MRSTRIPQSSSVRGRWIGAPRSAVLANAHSMYVIARGLGLGVAQEAALKFKETCGLHAEAFSAAEVKHGPTGARARWVSSADACAVR